MATILSETPDPELLNELKALLWGSSTLKEDVFTRWTQGFIFSEAAPCALVQLTGGPCSVIVPVQAFIIKCALFGQGETSIQTLSNASVERANSLLLEALVELLAQLHQSEYTVVTLQQTVDSRLRAESSSLTDDKETAAPALEAYSSSEFFHKNLKCHLCKSISELKAHMRQSLSDFHSKYGVLLYLYSILLTKGIQQIKNEVEDPTEPLIDGIHGHGSQSLLNLLLTSRATSNVWDNEKEISGLKLRGLQQQSTIGFLTLLEHMRYCEVGWFYKNPLYPIWVLGSETHLTLLFSQTDSLVVTDNPGRNAKQVFAQFDPEGNGFIPSSMLEDVMSSLDLVTEKEYVDIMREKMDSEGLGIITRSSFMEEFFPEETDTGMPKEFSLYHYNGLQHSNAQGKVCFSEGKATLADEIDTQFVTDLSNMKLCLQTKWPSIEITWSMETAPSLN